jgi:hypothetical protein
MKPHTANSSFLKAVFLSIAFLALGSGSVYAEQASQTVKKTSSIPELRKMVRKIYHFPGIGDAVRSTGQVEDPVIYSGITPVGNEWGKVDFTDPFVMYLCSTGAETGEWCEVKFDLPIMISSSDQEWLANFWREERLKDGMSNF